MQQDFSRRISVVINKSLQPWQTLNCLANITAHFGHYLKEDYGTDQWFVTKNGIKFRRNTQFPTIVFETDVAGVNSFAKEIINNDNIEKMFFVKEMIETSSDDKIQQSLGNKNFEEVEFLGVGIFGENTIVKDLTKGFKLWS